VSDLEQKIKRKISLQIVTFDAYYHVKTQQMKKQLLAFIGLIGMSVILLSWGGTGHYKINTASGLSFNAEMAQFNVWITTLANHASDADDRKAWDPTEGPKHYIDIDNYPEFVATGRIPQTLDSVIALHGTTFVYDQGILPWATLTTFDSLERCFERLDWAKAVLFASDLGHYVADGHMPLHITRNYNGQYSGNNGIHARYESTMINAYISQITYDGFEISEIENVNQYIFNYLYTDYSYFDSVMAADDFAQGIAGNTNSQAYKQALWDKSRSFTIPLFKNASHALTELIYTAWIQAGSPLMSPEFVISPYSESAFSLEQNIPNPFKDSTHIKFYLTATSNVLLQVFDYSGKQIATLINEKKTKGSYSVDWRPNNIKAGVYYLKLTSGNTVSVKKMIVMI